LRPEAGGRTAAAPTNADLHSPSHPRLHSGGGAHLDLHLWDLASDPRRRPRGAAWGRPGDERDGNGDAQASARIRSSATCAVPLGIISAVRQDTWVDHFARLFSISFLSVPSFFTAILTITFLSRWFHWIPPRGYIDFFHHPTLNLEQMILPALVLGLSTSAGTARLTRTTVLEVMREDYVRTARAKGLKEEGVIWRHVLRNAMPPVVVYWGVSLSALVTGAVLIEVVYGLSGMGRLLVDAIAQRDWPVVQTGVLFVVVLTLLLNLLIDLLHGAMDPRIKVT
jgi:peptide/nickel transport system permease protein